MGIPKKMEELTKNAPFPRKTMSWK